MLKKFLRLTRPAPTRQDASFTEQGRSEVRDAKKNERHVCGRARPGERPVSSGRGVSLSHPAHPELRLAALPRWYLKALSDARTTLERFCSILWLFVGDCRARRSGKMNDLEPCEADPATPPAEVRSGIIERIAKFDEHVE